MDLACRWRTLKPRPCRRQTAPVTSTDAANDVAMNLAGVIHLTANHERGGVAREFRIRLIGQYTWQISRPRC